MINETKRFLEKEGVSLDALQQHYQQKVKRSNTTILVKNLPFDTDIAELTELFSKHGSLARVCVSSWEPQP